MRRYNPFRISRLEDLFVDSTCRVCKKPTSHWRLDTGKEAVDICSLCLLYKTTFGEWVNVKEATDTLQREFGVPHIATDDSGKVVSRTDASMIVCCELVRSFGEMMGGGGYENPRD